MKASLRRPWPGLDPTLIAVPLALAAIEVLAQQAQLRFLLFPSLASIAYLLFTRPVGPHATWRGAVVAPTLGASIGTLGASAFSPGFLGVLVVAFATMLSMRLLRVTTPPVLAVAILPLVFGVRGLGYPASIFLATAVLFVLFRAEQRVFPADGRGVSQAEASRDGPRPPTRDG